MKYHTPLIEQPDYNNGEIVMSTDISELENIYDETLDYDSEVVKYNLTSPSPEEEYIFYETMGYKAININNIPQLHAIRRILTVQSPFDFVDLKEIIDKNMNTLSDNYSNYKE